MAEESSRARRMSRREALRLAADPSAAAADLAALAGSCHVSVRLAVAQNANIDDNTRELLANDPIVAIRNAIRNKWGEATPEPAPGNGAQGSTPDSPDRPTDTETWPLWVTTWWWVIIIAAEIALLVWLGAMAYGQRYPLVSTFVRPLSFSYIAPVTRSETVGTVILIVVGIGLLSLTGRGLWKPGLATVLAVVLAVVVFLFGWGTENRLSPDDGLSLPASLDASALCRERYPAAADQAFRRNQVPDECRNIWLDAATTTTTTPLLDDTFEELQRSGLTPTTTQLTVETARAELNAALDTQTRAALKALDDAHEVMIRTLDKTDQAAFLALKVADDSGDQALKDSTLEAARDTLDSLDQAAYALVVDAFVQLLNLLNTDTSAAIDRYLPLVHLNPSELDRFLNSMGLGLNTSEVDALLEALN